MRSDKGYTITQKVIIGAAGTVLVVGAGGVIVYSGVGAAAGAWIVATSAKAMVAAQAKLGTKGIETAAVAALGIACKLLGGQGDARGQSRTAPPTITQTDDRASDDDKGNETKKTSHTNTSDNDDSDDTANNTTRDSTDPPKRPTRNQKTALVATATGISAIVVGVGVATLFNHTRNKETDRGVAPSALVMN